MSAMTILFEKKKIPEIFQAVGKVIRLNERTYTSNDSASVD